MVRSEVGPLERCETPEPFTIAVQHVLTDASDRFSPKTGVSAAPDLLRARLKK